MAQEPCDGQGVGGRKVWSEDMPITKYAESLIASSAARPAMLWKGLVSGRNIILKLVDRNAYGRCLLEWPDGIVREMTWGELNRKFRAVGLE